MPPDYPKYMPKFRFQVICNLTRTARTGIAGFRRSVDEWLALTRLLVIQRRKPSFRRPWIAPIRPSTAGRDRHLTIRSHSNGKLHQPVHRVALEHRRWAEDATALLTPQGEELGEYIKLEYWHSPPFLAQQKR